VVGFLAGVGLSASPPALAIVAAVAMLVLSLDLTGTTPWYPSAINSFGNRFDLEALAERCTGAAECVDVCPRDVLRANRRVEIVRPDDCILCGACIVQCLEDVLRFRFADGRVVEPATVRSTRLNMLGRRSIRVDQRSTNSA
jgi:NAD-dependent dihydropyrimidine dehydrogenase PreA subunit